MFIDPSNNTINNNNNKDNHEEQNSNNNVDDSVLNINRKNIEYTNICSKILQISSRTTNVMLLIPPNQRNQIHLHQPITMYHLHTRISQKHRHNLITIQLTLIMITLPVTFKIIFMIEIMSYMIPFSPMFL